jgi:hypothetical protein
MELLERIEQQMAATQLPLFAITLAAVPCPDTPVILTLHWHAFVKERLAEVESAQPVAYKPVPSSALQLNERWEDVLTVDREAFAARGDYPRAGALTEDELGEAARRVEQVLAVVEQEQEVPPGERGNQLFVSPDKPLTPGDNWRLVINCYLSETREQAWEECHVTAGRHVVDAAQWAEDENRHGTQQHVIRGRADAGEKASPCGWRGWM